MGKLEYTLKYIYTFYYKMKKNTAEMPERRNISKEKKIEERENEEMISPRMIYLFKKWKLYHFIFYSIRRKQSLSRRNRVQATVAVSDHMSNNTICHANVVRIKGQQKLTL